MTDSFKTQTTRTKIIDACIEQGKTLDEANDKLKACDFHIITNPAEIELYENMRQSYMNSSLRKKLLENARQQGLSKFEINLILNKNNLRTLNEYEAEAYEYTLGRRGNIDINTLGKRTFEDEKPTREAIIKNEIKNKSPLNEINILLIQNGYEDINAAELEEYKKSFISSSEIRERIIIQGIKRNIKATELNKNLKNKNLDPLSQFEIVDYDQKKHKYFQNRRNDLIKYCVEQRKFIDEINDMLRKHNFERITPAEENKIIEQYSNNTDNTSPNTLSAAFQALYKEAIKQFHPDMYSNAQDKVIANERMKEINEAKSLRDYLKLQDLVEQYQLEDERDSKLL